MVDTVRNAVGPTVDIFEKCVWVQHVPLASNFSDLIDVADAGRKAAGQSPEQDGVPGLGFQLDASEKLALQPKAEGDIAVDSTGVGVIADVDQDIKVDASGVGMVVDASRGMGVNASGIGINFGASLQTADGKLEVVANAGIPKVCLSCFQGPSFRRAGRCAMQPIHAGDTPVSGTSSVKTCAVPTDKVSAGAINMTVNGTSLTVVQIPAHQHSSKVTWNTGSGAGGDTSLTTGNTPTPNNRTMTDSNGSGAPHSHSASATQGAHGHTVSITSWLLS